jgi:anti-anti-sigma factor
MADFNQIERDGLTVLQFRGSLNATGLEQIEQSFARLARQQGARVLVDLAAVDILTTPAISMFIAATRTANRHGGRIVFTQSNPRVADVLHRLRLDAVLRTIPSFEEAVSALKNAPPAGPSAAP